MDKYTHSGQVCESTEISAIRISYTERNINIKLVTTDIGTASVPVLYIDLFLNCCGGHGNLNRTEYHKSGLC